MIWDSVVSGTHSAERGLPGGVWECRSSVSSRPHKVCPAPWGSGLDVCAAAARDRLVTARCRLPAVGGLLLRTWLVPRGPRWLPRLPRLVRIPPAAVMRRDGEDVLEKWLVALLPGSHSCGSFPGLNQKPVTVMSVGHVPTEGWASGSSGEGFPPVCPHVHSSGDAGLCSAVCSPSPAPLPLSAVPKSN